MILYLGTEGVFFIMTLACYLVLDKKNAFKLSLYFRLEEVSSNINYNLIPLYCSLANLILFYCLLAKMRPFIVCWPNWYFINCNCPKNYWKRKIPQMKWCRNYTCKILELLASSTSCCFCGFCIWFCFLLCAAILIRFWHVSPLSDCCFPWCTHYN